MKTKCKVEYELYVLYCMFFVENEDHQITNNKITALYTTSTSIVRRQIIFYILIEVL